MYFSDKFDILIRPILMAPKPNPLTYQENGKIWQSESMVKQVYEYFRRWILKILIDKG